jgi:hypothetical protein
VRPAAIFGKIDEQHETGGRRRAMTTPMQPASKAVTVNGLSLHYVEWGESDAPPIVCVHGYTGSAQAFNALAGICGIVFISSHSTFAGMARAPGPPLERTNTPIRPATWRRSPTGSGSTNSR